MDGECALAEASDGYGHGVGGFCPAGDLGVAVEGFDVALDGGLEFGGGEVGAALDLLFGQEGEGSLDLIEP